MTPLFKPVNQWLQQHNFGEIIDAQAASGGSICNSYQIRTDKQVFFLKQLANAPGDLFHQEAEGLRAITETNSIATPQVYQVAHSYLLLEYLTPGQPNPSYWERLGHSLANMHNHLGPSFGFTADNYCGSTLQPNPKTDDGFDFFVEHRLLYQANIALKHDRINTREHRLIEALCRRLPELIPEQAPSLIHGDLWSGNILCSTNGSATLIDPAAHWGWAEAELGMTRLFGGFPEQFYSAYCLARPPENGWEERLDLYNLYHLLNHLNLFGSNYHPQTIGILKRFS